MQGLGNQMFQYAAGMALAKHLNTELKINIDSYSNTSLRQYELEKFFNIKTPVVAEQEMQLFTLSHPVRRLWNKFFPKQKIKALPYEEKNQIVRLLYALVYLYRKPHLQRVYEEKQFHYDANFFKAKQPVFLKGYWHSYKYFESIKNEIREVFTVNVALVQHLKDIADEIKNSNSVGLHIRCTDKLSKQHIELHGILDKSYYEKALEVAKKKLETNIIKVYVFTDDVIKAKEYLPNNYSYIMVSNNYTKLAIEDFYLMQQVKCMIIANSTFSWWAAYLNQSKNPLIIAPENWYVTSFYNHKDVYPHTWLKVSN